MLRFLSNVFSRKNRTQKRSPSLSREPTKPSKNTTRKSILKKSPSSTRKKSLTFSHDMTKEHIIERTPSEISYSVVPICNPPQRPKTYPCRNKYTIFDDVDEFNQYARDVSDKILKQRQRGLPTVSSHYKTMKTRLKESGSYKKRIPPEYRFYDENTGTIVDLRLFPGEDDE